jgi:hypothetical protein
MNKTKITPIFPFTVLIILLYCPNVKIIEHKAEGKECADKPQIAQQPVFGVRKAIRTAIMLAPSKISQCALVGNQTKHFECSFLHTVESFEIFSFMQLKEHSA